MLAEFAISPATTTMLRKRLTIALLALLAFLQGMMPLLHAHAGGSSAGEPHFHVSIGTTGDLGLHDDGLVLRTDGETVIDAAGGLSRDESLMLVDEPVVTPSAGARHALPAVFLGRSIRSSITLPRSSSFVRPPSQAPPFHA